MLGRGLNTARRIFFRAHERYESDNDRLDAPQRVPGLRVEVAEGRANGLVAVEASRRGMHHNGGRLHGVLRRKCNFSVVKAAFVVAVTQAKNEEVPHKNVSVARQRDVVVQTGPRQDLAAFFLQSDGASRVHYF